MTGYSTLQQDHLKKIGANLQEARVAQSKTVDDIAVQTYIRPQLLNAIEAGQVADLPQPIFVQGFIRRYAEALGLDGKTLAKQFPVHSIPNTPRPHPQPAAKPYGADAMANPVITARSAAKSHPLNNRPAPVAQPPKPVAQTAADASMAAQTAMPETSAAVSPAARVTAEDIPIGDTPLSDTDLERQAYGADGIVPPAQHPMARPVNRPLPVEERETGGGNPMPYVLAGVLAVGVVGAIALLFNMGGSNETQQAEVEPAPEVVEPVEPAPAPEPEPEPEPVSPSAASDAPVAVSISLTGDSWMSINVDGTNVFEGIMTSGTAELYEGQERVYMNIGNAGAVQVSYNGAEPEVAGPSGAVRELSYTP